MRGAKGIRGLLEGSHAKDGLDDFGEAFASLPGGDISGEMLHAVGEIEDVFDADGMREILEHGFVIERIPAEDEMILVIVQLQTPLLVHEELCHAELVVVPEPSVNVNR